MGKTNKRWWASRSVLLTWTLSYLAVLLLPVMLSSIVYYQSSRMLADEIHLANNSLLRQLRELMDKQIEAVNRLDFELSWNTKFRELVDQHKYAIFPEEYMYDLYDATKDMSLYQSAYGETDLFYIYLAARETVLLPGVYRSSRFAYNEHHKSSMLSYEEWTDILQRQRFKGFVSVKRNNENGVSVDALAYVSTYDYEEGKPSGANVILIDKSNILTSLLNIEAFSKGHVLIADSDNNVLVSSSSEELPARLPFDTQSGGMFIWESGGRQYEVFSIQSGVSNLSYISLVPSEVYWKKAELVRKLTFISILASLLGGGCLTYIFLRKNYNPLRQIVGAFNNKAALREKATNEFHFIQQAVDSTLNEMDNMMLEMKKQHHSLRSGYMLKWFKGKRDNELPLAEALTAFDIRLLSEDFGILLLYLEDVDIFLERIQGKTAAEKLRLLHFIVWNVVEELVNVKHRGYLVENDDAMPCLVSLSGLPPEEQAADLLQAARSAQEFLAQTYSIYITVSISRVHSGLEQIPQAYQEALEAMEYKLVMGKQEILAYEDIQQYSIQADTDSGYYFPLQSEQQLINYVKVGDFPAAKAALDEIVRMNFSAHPVKLPLARCLILDLAGALIKSMGELGAGRDNILTQNPKMIDRLSSSETLSEMQEQLESMLREVCDYAGARRLQNVQENRQRALTELISEVSAFIDQHYTDPGLNVSQLGQQFDMKPTYLSRLFKEQSGEGLLDTINKKRIDWSKQLIADKRLTVQEAAEKSGFNDVGTYIRTFKKLEGITPGKYKETIDG
ncbi:helix-turn-helix domain-containing protein [Paenibacillus camerounensis]|uniref:helix-turn-helix domain-containing protein n=1 Tax=Paenibacillus camerounensis TaxID=1243663 RepID=UPI0005A77482|nr:helix-turn-helix domain-containing protein [Paenibacillus camerounensis]